MKVLAIDIGGSNVKCLLQGETTPRKFPSGPTLTPHDLVKGVRQAAADWEFDVVSVGFPSPIGSEGLLKEPHNLGPGWVGFDFAGAFERPVKLINDAAMQAFGSYQSGRLLFLGLGTGLGSAMVVHGQIVPLELAHLPYRKQRSFEEYLGQRGLDRMGLDRWRRHVLRVVEHLRAAMVAEDTVIGGGNAKKLVELPGGVRRGDNRLAFEGGFRLWQTAAQIEAQAKADQPSETGSAS